MVHKIRRPGSDSHYCVLADLLFSILIATVTMISDRVSISEISVVQGPGGSSSSASDNMAPVFTMLASGELKIDETGLSIDMARDRLQYLRQTEESKNVVLRVAPDCKHQHVAAFYKLCHDLNVVVTEQLLIETK